MRVYIDTSSFFKVLVKEEFTDEVHRAIAWESEVIVSGITRLEIGIQVRALALSGGMSLSKSGILDRQVSTILEQHPFRLTAVSAGVFSTALRQHSGSGVHCRSLDRLHLAAMEELEIRRLMTHDLRQAEAARELGFEVVMPGME